MANKRRPEVRAAELRGLKYFKVLGPLFERLHDEATQGDKAGNRQLFFDQYASLLLLYFFNPIVTGLRSIQQASQLDKVQKLLGCERAALGSLSAASRVFDAEALHPIIAELARQAKPIVVGKEAAALRGLTAVDGSLLPALSKMAWALWVDDQHRAAKMHVHFDVLKGVPVDVTVTEGHGSETAQLRATLQPQRLYVIDRGYADYQLFDMNDRRVARGRRAAERGTHRGQPGEPFGLGARLQQRLGDREDAFAVEGVAVAEPQLLYFLLERALHRAASGR
mgnify:CR=1 FL=1